MAKGLVQRVIQSSEMEDLAALLDRCRRDAGATLAVLVDGDGLLIERAGRTGSEGSAGRTGSAPAAPPNEPDLPLAGAEATDLFAVADRLLMDALSAGSARECWLVGETWGVHAARLTDGAFTLLVLPADAVPSQARSAIDAVRGELEAGLE